MLTSLREQEVDPFNVHGRPIVIYRTEPTPLQVSDLGSLNFMTLVRHCKLRSQQPERQRERPLDLTSTGGQLLYGPWQGSNLVGKRK